jgi:hypothetical protein
MSESKTISHDALFEAWKSSCDDVTRAKAAAWDDLSVRVEGILWNARCFPGAGRKAPPPDAGGGTVNDDFDVTAALEELASLPVDAVERKEML